jgi:hypothetical protein
VSLTLNSVDYVIDYRFAATGEKRHVYFKPDG